MQRQRRSRRRLHSERRVEYRRCFIPADAFYEWQKLDAKIKQPFAIAMKDGKPYALCRAVGEVEGSRGG